MIELLDNNKYSQLINNLTFDYYDYLDWLDENITETFYTVSTTNAKIRNKDDWNTLGREIYDKSLVMEHAGKIINIISALKINNFIIEHEYRQFKWLPDDITDSDKYGEIEAYFHSRLQVLNVKNIDNKLFVSDEINSFVSTFIDYSYLLNYRNIDVISQETNLVIKLTHHLTVDFISSDKMMIYEIMSLCNLFNLSFNNSPLKNK